MKLKTTLILILAGLVIAYLVLDKFNTANEYKKLLGKYEAYREISTAGLKRSIIIIGTLEKEITKQNKKIEKMHEIIVIKDKDLTEIENKLGDLKKEFKTVEECQAQYNELAKGFILAKSIIADKDQIIFRLSKKYDLQVEITNKYISLYESEKDLRLKAEEVYIQCGKSLKKIKFINNVKTGLAIILAVFVIKGLIK